MFKATQVVVGSVDWLLGLSGCFSRPVLLQVQPSSVLGTKAPTALVSSCISRLLFLSPYVCFWPLLPLFPASYSGCEGHLGAHSAQPSKGLARLRAEACFLLALPAAFCSETTRTFMKQGPHNPLEPLTPSVCNALSLRADFHRVV